MKFSEIKIGTRLELEIYNKFGTVIKPSMVSQFEEYKDEITALIAAPIYEGVIFAVHIGAIIDVYLTQDNELYKFKVRVIDRGVKDRIALLKIELIGSIIKIQRRQYFRFECLNPLEYRVFSSINIESELRGEFQDGLIKDLSGGGMCILINETADLNNFIECRFSLDAKKVNAIGNIVRVSKKETGAKVKYEVGCSFIKIDDKARDNIISYIFQQQRKLMKKGLI